MELREVRRPQGRELWRRLPRWPLESYDTVMDSRPCRATLGMDFDGRRFLRDGRDDRGTGSRQEPGDRGTGSRQELCDGGVYPRQERDGPGQVSGGGINSRHELPQGHDGVM